MLVKDNFFHTFKNNYSKIKIIIYLYRINRQGVGSFDLELINENFVNIPYLDKNDISLKIDTNKNNISSNLGKITTNEGNISTNLGKMNTNVSDISSNLGKITTNEGNILSNLGKINTSEGNISSNLGKIDNITKTIMLKNIYFTDFNSKKDEAIINELLHLDNTPDKFRAAIIHTANMEYYFKKDDFIEIDCKLMFSHSTYEHADKIIIYYDLYEGEKADQNKMLFRELHRYNQFPLIVNKDRIITCAKICYKVKYNINNILFLVQINAIYKK